MGGGRQGWLTSAAAKMIKYILHSCSNSARLNMVSQCNIYVVQYSMLEMNRKEKNKVSKVGKMGSRAVRWQVLFNVRWQVSQAPAVGEWTSPQTCSETYGVVRAWGGSAKFSRLGDSNLLVDARYWFALRRKVARFDLEYLSHVGKIPLFLPLVRSAVQVNQHLGTGKWPHFCHHMALILLLTHISTLPQTSCNILREQLKRRSVVGPSYIQYRPYIKAYLLSATIWQM